MTEHPGRSSNTNDGTAELYVIDHPDDYQKLGVAGDPSHRVEKISTGTPYQLSLRTTVTAEKPVTTETKLHSILETHHYRREWYDLPERISRRLTELDYLCPDSIGWQLDPVLEECELVQSQRAKLNAADPR